MHSEYGRRAGSGCFTILLTTQLYLVVNALTEAHRMNRTGQSETDDLINFDRRMPTHATHDPFYDRPLCPCLRSAACLTYIFVIQLNMETTPVLLSTIVPR